MCILDDGRRDLTRSDRRGNLGAGIEEKMRITDTTGKANAEEKQDQQQRDLAAIAKAALTGSACTRPIYGVYKGSGLMIDYHSGPLAGYSYSISAALGTNQDSAPL